MFQVAWQYATHEIKSEVVIWHSFLFINQFWTLILTCPFFIFFLRFSVGTKNLLGKSNIW